MLLLLLCFVVLCLFCLVQLLNVSGRFQEGLEASAAAFSVFLAVFRCLLGLSSSSTSLHGLSGLGVLSGLSALHRAGGVASDGGEFGVAGNQEVVDGVDDSIAANNVGRKEAARNSLGSVEVGTGDRQREFGSGEHVYRVSDGGLFCRGGISGSDLLGSGDGSAALGLGLLWQGRGEVDGVVDTVADKVVH